MSKNIKFAWGYAEDVCPTSILYNSMDEAEEEAEHEGIKDYKLYRCERAELPPLDAIRILELYEDEIEDEYYRDDGIFPSPYGKGASEEYKKSFKEFEKSINKAFEKFCKENKIESDMWIYERIYCFNK